MCNLIWPTSADKIINSPELKWRFSKCRLATLNRVISEYLRNKVFLGFKKLDFILKIFFKLICIFRQKLGQCGGFLCFLIFILDNFHVNFCRIIVLANFLLIWINCPIWFIAILIKFLTNLLMVLLIFDRLSLMVLGLVSCVHIHNSPALLIFF